MSDLDGAPVTRSVATNRDIHWGWYLFSLVLYVALALTTLRLRDNVLLLNWIIGPLFPLVVLYLIPTAVRALIRRGSGR